MKRKAYGICYDLSKKAFIYEELFLEEGEEYTVKHDEVLFDKDKADKRIQELNSEQLTENDLDDMGKEIKAIFLNPTVDGKTLAKQYKEADKWFNGDNDND